MEHHPFKSDTEELLYRTRNASGCFRQSAAGRAGISPFTTNMSAGQHAWEGMHQEMIPQPPSRPL